MDTAIVRNKSEFDAYILKFLDLPADTFKHASKTRLTQIDRNELEDMAFANAFSKKYNEKLESINVKSVVHTRRDHLNSMYLNKFRKQSCF